MENQITSLLEQYQTSHVKSYNFFMHGIDIIKTLLNRNFEAYIVGASVRNLYLNKEIDTIEIVSTATVEQLKSIFPAIIVDNRIVYLKDHSNYFTFIEFPKTQEGVSGKIASKYYNKKLLKVLVDKIYTVNSLVITPNMLMVDVFDSVKDLDSNVIRTIDKPKNIYINNPLAILDALVLVSEYGFDVDAKCLKAMSKCCSYLDSVKVPLIIRRIRQILKGEYAKDAFNVIVKNKLFRYIKVFDLFAKKIIKNFSDLSLLERVCILYLLIGSIPDASLISDAELKEITETMTIAQLVSADEITPMMVYNIGAEKLYSANRIALTYKPKYSDQTKKIKKLEKQSVISSPRDLQFSELEIIDLYGGERSVRVRIVLNMLLAKVINKEVYNHHTVLRKEAQKIIQHLASIYDYEEPEITPNYTDEYIEELKQKYDTEYEFLVKIYLSDERALYNLSALERDEIEEEAKTHAKEFLLETSQYKILEERGLI